MIMFNSMSTRAGFVFCTFNIYVNEEEEKFVRW